MIYHIVDKFKSADILHLVRCTVSDSVVIYAVHSSN